MTTTNTPPPYEDFGKAVKQHRLVAGLTLAECAIRAHMSERNLRKIEKGEQRPHLQTIQNLATVLQVPMERLNKTLLQAPADELFSEAELDRLADLLAERLAPRLRRLLREKR